MSYLKGISPLLATVLLVAATVAITTMLSGWVSSTMGTTQNTITNRTDEGVACAAAEIVIDDVYSGQGSGSRASAIVRNSGGTDSLAVTSAQLYDIFGNNFTATNSLPVTLNKGQMATLSFNHSILPTTTNDSAHGINNGTLTNGPIYKTGKYMSGMSFDGINDTIVVSTSTSLNVTGNITIEAWFKANSIPTGDVQIANKGSYGLYMSSGEVAGSASLNNNNTLWNYSTSLNSAATYSVAIDSSNNIIAAGYDTTGGNQWRIMKLDTNGNSLWNYTSNPTSDSDVIYAAAIDSSNSIIAAGYDTSNQETDYQWRIMKLDSNGNWLWNYTSNISSDSDIIYAVAIDSNNSIIAAGSDSVLGSLNKQWHIMKLDTNGNLLWNYTSNPTSGSDIIYGIAIDSSNSIIAAGYDTTGGNQWRIMKLDSNGNWLWNYTSNPSSGSDIIYGVAIDSSNSIIAAGYDTLNGDVDYQWRIMKFDSNGNWLWNYTSNPTSGSDDALTIAIDSSNSIIAAGYDSTGSTQWRIMKLDSNGNWLWNYTSNPSTISDIPYSVAIDSNNNIIAAGYDNAVGSNQMRIMKLGNLVNGTTTLSAGTWYHGAFVYNGTHMNAYRDGILEGSNAVSLSNMQASVWNLSLGAKGGLSYKYGTNFPIGIGSNFNGTIDDIAIWNRSLTNAEINTSMNVGPLSVSNTNDLVGYWKFDEGKGVLSCPSDFSRVVVTTNCGGVSAEFAKPPKC